MSSIKGVALIKNIMGLSYNDCQEKSHCFLILCVSDHHQRSELLRLTLTTLAFISKMTPSTSLVWCTLPTSYPYGTHSLSSKSSPFSSEAPFTILLSETWLFQNITSTTAVVSGGWLFFIHSPPTIEPRPVAHVLIAPNLHFQAIIPFSFKPLPLWSIWYKTTPPAALVAAIPWLI